MRFIERPQLIVPERFESPSLRLARAATLTTTDLVLLLLLPFFGAMVLLGKLTVSAGSPCSSRYSSAEYGGN